jgi:hypothetical protein
MVASFLKMQILNLSHLSIAITFHGCFLFLDTASQSKKKWEGIRISKHIYGSVESEVLGNEVQHTAPSAAEHRAEMEPFNVIENDL